MKSLCFLSALAILALPTSAQEVEIIGIDHFGTITWSNSPTPLYCGVEGKWDMGHTWLPMPDWDLLVTTPVTNTTSDVMALWEAIRGLVWNLSGGTEQANGLFFRVVASSSPLAPRYATNFVHVANASTSILANVEIGSIDNGSYTPITNLASLAQGSNSPPIPVAENITPPWLAPVTNIVPMVVDPPLQEGWYVTYEQSGSNRVAQAPVLPFGKPEKNVTVTVSNDSVTITYQWYGLARTFPY
jgi:hypothetical protein